MDRYRTSLHSQSPGTRSYMTDGHVKSNLESRIEYENSQVSLISLIKVLAIISTLILLLIATKFALDARVRSEECGRKASFSQYISRLRYRLFGGVNPDSCESKVDKVEDEIEGGKVEVVTKTTTCKRKDKEDGEEGNGIWSYLTFPSFGCEDYKAHEAALKNQKFSVKDGLQSPPSLSDAAKPGNIEEPAANLEKFAEITEANSKEIQNQFDALLGNFAAQAKGRAAGQAADGSIDVEDSAQIDKSKKLLEKPTVFDLQLRVNDLLHSSRNLSKKKQALLNFQDRFYNSTKTPNSCTKEIRELKQKLDIENEKFNHSISIRKTWEGDLKKLQESIDSKTKENENSGPLGLIQKLKDEIEALQKKKADALKFQAEINNKLAQIAAYQLDISKLNSSISEWTTSSNDFSEKIAALKRQIEDFNHSIKVNDNKRMLLEMKLELAKRNKHIKDFLLSLIENQDGKVNDLQALFADKLSSEHEMKAILKSFINQSRAKDNETGMTDDQIDLLIKQDEKDFTDITKLYTELVKVINEYKDIDFDISSMSISINELDTKKAHAQIEIKRLIIEIEKLENSKGKLGSDIERNYNGIREFEEKITKHNLYISKNTINISVIDGDIALKTKEHDDLREQWKVI